MTGSFTEYAFEIPVRLACGTQIRTASQAAELVMANMQTLFTMHGLNAVLILERALGGDEVEEARAAFCGWATQEGLA